MSSDNVVITIHTNLETDEITVSDSLNEFDEGSCDSPADAEDEAEAMESEFRARGLSVTYERI
jgi:hypothetical protein